jgi:hypothetical protein
MAVRCGVGWCCEPSRWRERPRHCRRFPGLVRGRGEVKRKQVSVRKEWLRESSVPSAPLPCFPAQPLAYFLPPWLPVSEVSEVSDFPLSARVTPGTSLLARVCLFLGFPSLCVVFVVERAKSLTSLTSLIWPGQFILASFGVFETLPVDIWVGRYLFEITDDGVDPLYPVGGS